MKKELMNVLVLDKDERVLNHWQGKVETFMKTVVKTRRKGKVVEAKEVEKGFLILSDRNLYWITERGRFGKTYRVTHEISLEDIRSISSGGIISKFISVIDSNNEYQLRINIPPEVFDIAVRDAMEARKVVLAEEEKKKRIHMVLDFSALSEQMQAGGLSLQTVKCTNCGVGLQLPETGNEITCEHCGTVIYAQDVFEKIKDLIS